MSQNPEPPIVQELLQIQKRYHHLPASELRTLAARIETPMYRLHEVASFFPHFRFDPPPEIEVQICRDMSCHHAGSGKLGDDLKERCHQLVDEHRLHVEGVSCLGRCDRAPAVMVNDLLFVRRTVDDLILTVNDLAANREVRPDTDTDYTACTPTMPWEIDPYDPATLSQYEPYEAVKRLMKQLDAAGENGAEAVRQSVFDALITSDLRGMGGAGEPTGRKWQDVLVAEGDVKYVVCNADESEPGTFKDRELLLRKSHLILEGMIAAGLVLGATRGIVYVRHEYPEQINRMKQAIREAERAGVCGTIMRSGGRSFPMEVFVSPGGYICGEQSALIQAIENKRAEPRNRPPTLATNGLWDKPTLVNNVETFAWVPAILLRENGEWYRDAGVNGAKGRRFFSISGDVTRPGVYEVPAGITVGEFIREYAKGMRGDVEMKAFAPSGPSGGLLPRMIPMPDGSTLDLFEVPMDLDGFRKVGLMLGAGVVAYGPQTDVVREAVNAIEFFRNESCGKCVPCRIGSQKLAELGGRVLNRRYSLDTFEGEREIIEDLSEAMGLTSICGLGQVASNPLSTLVKYFRADIDRYLDKSV